MIGKFLIKIFGSRNSRIINDYAIYLMAINDLESFYEKNSDDELKNLSNFFPHKYINSNIFDELFTEPFPVFSEASSRPLGMPHFDEPFNRGIALHHGRVSDLKGVRGKP
jgi:Preprotein translocase subunit SecA (ATPase, RNA helicase)